MNERTRKFKKGDRVLVVFHGPHLDEFVVDEDRGDWILLKNPWESRSRYQETFRIIEVKHEQIVGIIHEMRNPNYDPS
jgi:hypothetical protein